MGWLDNLVNSTEESEAPEIYFYWSGLAVISALVKNNVYLERHTYKLYPNIYVVLIGRSGLHKGIPISYAKEITSVINNTRIISGRNSIQAIIRDLGLAYTLPDGNIIKDSIGFLVASEFANLLIKDPEALTIITDLYDGHYNDEWKNTLKGTGVETLKNVCLTMLGASNEVHFKDVVPLNAIGGGFIGRTMLICADEERCYNSLTAKPTKLVPKKELAEQIKYVSKIKGEFKWSKEAIETYDDWYYPFKKKKLIDSTGTLQRIGDHVLKVAMLIAMSNRDGMTLHSKDIEEAITRCMDAAIGTQKVFTGTGQAPLGKQTKLLLVELLKHPEGLVRNKILTKFWGEMDYLDLDRIIENLEQAKLLETTGNGGKATYKLTQKAVDSIQSFMEG